MQATAKPQGFDARKRLALSRLRSALQASARPVVLSSFGKDSLCVLALTQVLNCNTDIAYFELGCHDAAHRFARDFIQMHGLEVIALRPHATAAVFGTNGVDIGYTFQLESGDSIHIVGATFDDRSSTGLLCGLQTSVRQAGSHEPYLWDMIISGRRASDCDETFGPLGPIEPLVSLANGATVLMPIVDWSDEDVSYFLSTEAPYKPDPKRYIVRAGQLRTRKSRRYDPDYARVCVRCLTSRGREPLECPLGKPYASRTFALNDNHSYRAGKVPPTVML